ncbi:MAG: ABC transporter, partial [Bacteroidetes bacterium QH_1_61_8]
WANPVSYAVSGLRHGLHGFSGEAATLVGPGLCLGVTGGFAILMIGMAVWQVRRPFFET